MDGYFFDAEQSLLFGGVAVPEGASDAWVTIECAGKMFATLPAREVVHPALGLDEGAVGFSCTIPPLIRGAAGCAITIWDLGTGERLPGPGHLPPALEAVGLGEEDEVVPGQEPRRWPQGLAGVAKAGLHELAENLWCHIDAAAGGAQFNRIDGPRFADAPSWALRVRTGQVAPLVFYLKVPRVLSDAQADLRLYARLPKAETDAAHVQADFILTRWTGTEFQRVRMLKRARVFRPFGAVDFPLRSADGSFEFEPGEDVYLTIACSGAGLVLCPPVAAPSPFGGTTFEDNRLTGAFSACRVLGEVHERGLDEKVMPGVAGPSPAVPRGGQNIPFTQIIIPVYNGADVVVDCVAAVRDRTDTPFQILLMDDGSRGYTAELLRQLAASDPRIVLYRRDINRGYTKSINEAVKLTSAEWVVILNSDTVVSQGWLRKLHSAVHVVPNTGMVGALSNAATWQSIPHAKKPDGSWSNNDFIESRHVPQIQAIVEANTERAYPTAPVLNGFCTLIARAVFEQCDIYDEDAFPMGYGEETDLCLRARRAGFKLVIADDCFVYHEKSVSFGSATRSKLTRAGGFELRNKHLGVTIPALEQQMQREPAMTRLRAKLSQLEGMLS